MTDKIEVLIIYQNLFWRLNQLILVLKDSCNVNNLEIFLNCYNYIVKFNKFGNRNLSNCCRKEEKKFIYDQFEILGSNLISKTKRTSFEEVVIAK